MTYEVIKTVKMRNGRTWSAMAKRFSSMFDAEQYMAFAAMMSTPDTTWTVREA